jgi:hypothetical protein
MTHTSIFTNLFLAITISFSSVAQTDCIGKPEWKLTDSMTFSSKQKKINFFIVSKPTKKIDPASWYNIARTKIKGFFRRESFVSIIAKNVSHMTTKVQNRLRKSNAVIGTIWFDSHGVYKRGFAVFFIGSDELNYKSVKDSQVANSLQQLSNYTRPGSCIVIGSCYGGATFLRKDLHSADSLRMNGDSLMMGLGKILGTATIYGSESWVMTKPGLFHKKAAVAGHPAMRLFKDVVYRPAWQNIGRWNQYNACTDSFSHINPVTLDIHGNAQVRKNNYSEKKEVKKRIEKTLQKLQPGLLKIK